MTRNQFLILLGVLAVLVAAGAWVMYSQRSDWRSSDARVGQRLVPGLIVANVAEIRIQEAGNEVTLERKDGNWHVRERLDFPANVERIGELLVKLAELKVTQVEPLGEKQRSRLDLAEPKADAKNAGTLLELKDKDGKNVTRLLLGKKVVKQSQTTAPTKGTPDPTGRYVVGAEKDAVAVVPDPLSNVEGRPAPWLAKDLVRVHNAKTMTSLTGEGKVRWTVTRASESADWKAADGGPPVDNNRVQDLVSVLIYIALADVATDPSKAGFDQGVTLRIDTFHNTHYTLQLGRQEGDLRYMRIGLTGDPPKTRMPGKDESAEDKEKKDKEFEDNYKGQLMQLEREGKLKDWTFLVRNSDIESLLRDRAQLLPQKKDEKAKSAK
jgi:hypothetical protein